MENLFAKKPQRKGIGGLAGLTIGLGLAGIILVAIALIITRFDTAISDGTSVQTVAENISALVVTAMFTLATFFGIFTIIGVMVLVIRMLVGSFGGGQGGAV